MAAFVALQIAIVWFAANGPFVDEGLYTVAGMRVLEGRGAADGYSAWFNGSPLVWPVMAALGHHLGGLPGARCVAILLSMVTLVAFARTAASLFGESAAAWGTAALAANGLFMALAHFAVYDVPALTAVAVAMWCVARSSRADDLRWLIGAGIAFGAAAITKYGYLPLIVPLAGLLVSTREVRLGRGLAVLLGVAGGMVGTYFFVTFGTPVPTSMGAYLEQTFRRSRGHIAVLQIVFGLAPLMLATAGAIVAWRRRHRRLVVTCLLALSLYPVFHLWTGNFVSGQKHVVAGFLFAFLLGGLALDRMWKVPSRRVTLVGLLCLLAVWGGLQWHWQEHSWTDTRILTRYLAQHMKPGERIIADSSWIYILSLYPAGLIASPSDVIDANYAPDRDRLDVCQASWLVGNLDTAEMIRTALESCGHRPVLATASRQYYFDTSRLWLRAFTVIVGLYRLPAP